MAEYKSCKLIFPILYGALCKALSSLKGTLFSWQRFKFNLVVIHAMMHYVDYTHPTGSSFEYHVNMYECLHIVHFKQAYRRRNL
jgi:hypothetical protein